MTMHALITGCSHTAGIAIAANDCYVSVLDRHYKFPIINHGVPGGSCNDVLMKIVNEITHSSRPEFIVAQWPNPFRKTCWINGVVHLQNINSCDESFNLLLKNGDANFYEPWMQAIIIANLLCKIAKIPLYNILLENINPQYLARLEKENIVLHVDEKLPGLTWLFDSSATDKSHHSAICHKQWAERLVGIIDEHTTS